MRMGWSDKSYEIMKQIVMFIPFIIVYLIAELFFDTAMAVLIALMSFILFVAPVLVVEEILNKETTYRTVTFGLMLAGISMYIITLSPLHTALIFSVFVASLIAAATIFMKLSVAF